MFSGANKSSFASLKLLSGSVGGTQRSSAQKKWTRSKETARVLACSTVAAKNFCVMRPPESATQCVLPARLADSISSSHAWTAARASSSALAKESSSKFFISNRACFDVCQDQRRQIRREHFPDQLREVLIPD